MPLLTGDRWYFWWYFRFVLLWDKNKVDIYMLVKLTPGPCWPRICRFCHFLREKKFPTFFSILTFQWTTFGWIANSQHLLQARCSKISKKNVSFFPAIRQLKKAIFYLFYVLFVCSYDVQWNSVMTNIILSQIGHFNTQINPVITNPGYN